jgi:GDP-4-dehydro-6-deoxy-D-mannose reductase
MAPDPSAILLTGASGFVGRHLRSALATAFPAARLLTPRFDIRDPTQVEETVRAASPDVCIHLAAIAAIGSAREAPDRAWAVNFHGTMNLAWALSAHAPQCQMVFISSADAYGGSFKNGQAANGQTPLAPMNVYAHTKAAADLALGGMAAQGLRVVRLRPFNHTGPGQTTDFAVPADSRRSWKLAIWIPHATSSMSATSALPMSPVSCSETHSRPAPS